MSTRPEIKLLFEGIENDTILQWFERMNRWHEWADANAPTDEEVTLVAFIVQVYFELRGVRCKVYTPEGVTDFPAPTKH